MIIYGNMENINDKAIVELIYKIQMKNSTNSID